MANEKETLIQAYCIRKIPDGTPCGWRGKGRKTLKEATGDGGRHEEETTVTNPDGSGRRHTFSIGDVPAP